MISKGIDRWNRTRPEGEPEMTKMKLARKLVEKGLIKSEASAVQIFKRLDKGQDKINMKVLRELSVIFAVTYETLIDKYFFNDKDRIDT